MVYSLSRMPDKVSCKHSWFEYDVQPKFTARVTSNLDVNPVVLDVSILGIITTMIMPRFECKPGKVRHKNFPLRLLLDVKSSSWTPFTGFRIVETMCVITSHKSITPSCTCMILGIV